MPDTERRNLELVWLYCSRCYLEHEAELWREGRYDYVAMRWVGDPHQPAEVPAYA